MRHEPLPRADDPISGPPRIAIVLVALLVLGAVVFVATSLDRPVPPTRAPDPPQPRAFGDSLVGPYVTTVDATNPRVWTRFDFSRGSVVPADDLKWDLAFRRHRVIANGGPGFAGRGGIVDLGQVEFDEVVYAPAEGYVVTRARGDTINLAIQRWYDYGFTSHILTPRPRVYAVRTADGRYAKIGILGYYCPGAQPGCVTFRWSYQGDGSRRIDSQGTSNRVDR